MNELISKRVTEDFFNMTNKRYEKKIKEYIDKKVGELTERCKNVQDFCQVSCEEIKGE